MMRTKVINISGTVTE